MPLFLSSGPQPPVVVAKVPPGAVNVLVRGAPAMTSVSSMSSEYLMVSSRSCSALRFPYGYGYGYTIIAPQGGYGFIGKQAAPLPRGAHTASWLSLRRAVTESRPPVVLAANESHNPPCKHPTQHDLEPVETIPSHPVPISPWRMNPNRLSILQLVCLPFFYLREVPRESQLSTIGRPFS